MFSYVDSYGTQIWFLLESGTSQIDLDIKDYDNNSLLEYTFEVVNKYNLKQFPFTIYQFYTKWFNARYSYRYLVVIT